MPENPADPGSSPPADDSQLALKRLTAALAEMLGPPEVSQPAMEGAAEEGGPAAAAADQDECCPITPRSILEALLFVGRPGGYGLRTEDVVQWIRDVDSTEIERGIVELNAQYAAEGAPYAIQEEGGTYRLVLTPDFQRSKRRLSGRGREARLSQAAVEVLALVAYNQPIAGAEISRLRGKPSGHIITHLVRRQLLQIERQPDRPRTPYYLTTPRFLTLFGLAGLADLPQTQELDS
jgi:segregation and condensation protein B